MKILFELNPTELRQSIKNGSLETFIDNAKSDEQALSKVDKKVWSKPTITEVTPPVQQAPVQQAPAVITPVQDAPAVITSVQDAPVNNWQVNGEFVGQPVEPTMQVVPKQQDTAQVNMQVQAQPTIDEVRAKIAPLIKQGKMDQVTALFTNFGAQKLTDIAPQNYLALIQQASAL